MVNFLQVSTATPTREDAMALAASAVNARLAGSAQVIGPVLSAYWHQGAMGTGEEWQVLLRTTADRYPALEAHLLREHPWQNPEIMAVPVAAGSARWLAWLRGSVGDPG